MNLAPDLLLAAPHLPVQPIYVRVLMDVARGYGVNLSAALQEMGLRPGDLAEDAPPLQLSAFLALVQAIRLQCDDPMLPITCGRRIRPNMHGIVGTAIFASKDVRQALRTMVELGALRTSIFRVQLYEVDDRVRLEFEPLAPLFAQQEFLTTVVALSDIQVLWVLLGRHISRVCIEFPFDEPWWAAEREGHCPSQVRFGADRLAFDLPVDVLDRAVPSADAKVYEAALRQCHLNLRGFALSMSARVAAFLANGSARGQPITLDETAEHFCMSSRTLRRVLMSESTSYQQIFDAVRMESARLLLKHSTLSVQQIADQIGYADPSNFVRAFKLRHGQTPRRFREGLQSSVDRSASPQVAGSW